MYRQKTKGIKSKKIKKETNLENVDIAFNNSTLTI